MTTQPDEKDREEPTPEAGGDGETVAKRAPGDAPEAAAEPESEPVAETSEDEDAAIVASVPVDEGPEKVYRQSRWAWGWPLIPWGVLIAFQIWIAGDPIFTLMFFVLAGIMTLPRYLRWRSTTYRVSPAGIKVTHQSASGSQDFEVEFNEVVSVEVERGFLDRTLGYKTIAILLEDRGLAKLTFVPVEADLDEEINARVKESPA